MGRGKDRTKRKAKMKNVLAYNTQYVYNKMLGGKANVNALAKNPNNKLNAKTAHQYQMAIAKSYAQALDRNEDPNIGLASINKKYDSYFR